MTQLELLQRGLLDLVKGRGAPPTDPYLSKVASSRGIVVVREIAVWWRAFQISAQCPLVTQLLKQRAEFTETIQRYFSNHRTSPFVEELVDHFLGFLGGHHDPFLRSVAAFERALSSVRSGSTETYEVYFDRNPDLAFETLQQGATIPEPELKFRYRMTVASDLPGMFCCTRENADVPPPGF